MKKNLLTFFISGLLVMAVSPVLAKMSTSTNVSTSTHAIKTKFDGRGITSTNVSTSTIACVGAAVATREAALEQAINAYNQSVAAAYTARAAALAQAYSATTTANVRAGIQSAWSAFRSATKTAEKTWRTAKNAAWAAFRKVSESCKAPGVVVDNNNFEF